MTDAREIDRIVGAALDEDAPWGDLTSETLIPADAIATADLVAREPGVLSGVDVFAAAFRLVDPRITVEPLARDGEAFETGATLARVAGPARGILRAERVGLNLLQRMSGIATLTARVRRRGRGHRRAHRRHAQDHAGTAQPRAAGGARRRRAQPPPVALRRGHGEGQPPRRAHRGRAGPRDRPARGARADAPHDPPRGRGRPARPGRGGARRRSRHGHARQLRASTTCDAVSSSSPAVPSSRRRAGSTSTRSPRSPRPGVDVISVGALTHSVRSLDLGLDVVVEAARGAGAQRPDGAAVIFLDHAATTPVRREALEAMWPYLSGAFGNPSSRHGLGDEAARALAAARARVAAVARLPTRRRRLHERRHRGRQPRGQGPRAREPARPTRGRHPDRARGGPRVGRLPREGARLRGRARSRSTRAGSCAPTALARRHPARHDARVGAAREQRDRHGAARRRTRGDRACGGSAHAHRRGAGGGLAAARRSTHSASTRCRSPVTRSARRRARAR